MIRVLKKKGPVFLVVILMLVMFTASVFAASSRYSYDMKNRMVDGKRNNEFHNLSSGKAYIDGSHRTTYSEYPFARKESINYTLYKNQFGFDKEIGTVGSSADSSIYGSFGSIDSGKYYLKVWKTNIDYHHTSGSGKVSN